MKKKILVWGMGVGILLCLFLGRELWIGSQHSLRIFGEKEFAVVQTSLGKTFFFGNTQTSRKDALLRAIHPYFSSNDAVLLSDQEIGTVLEGSDFTLTRISENIARGIFGNTAVWFWGDPAEEEISVLKSTPVKLESDFWILEGNNYSNFLPLPVEAVLHINERKPSKKLESFAREKNIPLVTVQGTGGFALKREDSMWKLRIR